MFHQPQPTKGEISPVQSKNQIFLWSLCWLWISMLSFPSTGRNGVGKAVFIKAQSPSSSCLHLPGGHM